MLVCCVDKAAVTGPVGDPQTLPAEMAVAVSVRGTTLAALVNAASRSNYNHNAHAQPLNPVLIDDTVSLLLFGTFERWETTEVSDSSDQHRQLHQTVNITSVAEISSGCVNGRGRADCLICTT
jgi:hypothetical protein